MRGGLWQQKPQKYHARSLGALKQRSLRAGLILLAADLDQLLGWIDPDAAELEALMTDVRAPTTWIIRAGPLAGDWITGGRAGVAVRLSGHQLATDLCQAVGGPIVSTSANRRGRPPARTAVDFVLAGPTGGWPTPSEIRVAATGARLRGA